MIMHCSLKHIILYKSYVQNKSTNIIFDVLDMVHIAKEILFSRTKYPRFKSNKDMCKKHIIFIQYMSDYRNVYGIACSSPVLAV